MAVEGRGVLYIGHLPAGFEEKELKDYFSQFGTVTRLKLSRSTRTGGSKGYAFVEFASEEVAGIAAESMHGYLMFNKVLTCKVVPSSKIHPSLFHGCNRKFKPSLSWKRSVRTVNKNRNKEEAEKATGRLRSRVGKRLKTLRALGLNPPQPIVNEKAKEPEPASKPTTAAKVDMKKKHVEKKLMKKQSGALKNKIKQ